jgi:hypothetical protein
MYSISTPLDYSKTHTQVIVKRDLKTEEAIIDNLLDLIIFTPKGSFFADPEFGFEYWDQEYTNPQYDDFNSGQNRIDGKNSPTVTKNECEASIYKSLLTYAPQLINVKVTVELNPAPVKNNKRHSKHSVHVCVKGDISDGISTTKYGGKEGKNIYFMMAPTTKRLKRF